MSDMIQGPPKTVQQAHNLRTVRSVKLNEERSDEERRLAEMEERMRNARRRKPNDRRDRTKGKGPEERLRKDGHIDFTA
jgi:hypothetical protein